MLSRPVVLATSMFHLDFILHNATICDQILTNVRLMLSHCRVTLA